MGLDGPSIQPHSFREGNVSMLSILLCDPSRFLRRLLTKGMGLDRAHIQPHPFSFDPEATLIVLAVGPMGNLNGF